MDYKNIVRLIETGMSLSDAKLLDASGILAGSVEHDEWCETQNDLEDRGFLLGTDDQRVIDRIEQQEMFDDRYSMYANEY